MFECVWERVYGCQRLDLCPWVMVAAAGCWQDVPVHKYACVFLHLSVCASHSTCPRMLVASACVQVLLGRRALHVYERVFVFFVWAVETIAQSQHVNLGFVPQRSPFALASVYSWTKGWSETNDLAPVSQSRRTRDEKRKRSEMGKGKMMEASRQTVKEAWEYKEGERRG